MKSTYFDDVPYRKSIWASLTYANGLEFSVVGARFGQLAMLSDRAKRLGGLACCATCWCMWTAIKGARRRAHFAIDLATRIGARISGLHVTPPADGPPWYKPSRLAEMTAGISSKLTLDARTVPTIFCGEATERILVRGGGRDSQRYHQPSSLRRYRHPWQV
jgi:hypothetical protein